MEGIGEISERGGEGKGKEPRPTVISKSRRMLLEEDFL